MIINRKNITTGSLVVILVVFLIGGGVLFISQSRIDHNSNEYTKEYNDEIIIEKNNAIKDLLAEGRYKCCMKKPCFRCFSKKENQEKDLVCDCLVDIMNGKHPCGECIGEILEGEGNPLVAEYFATAIAEKFGKQHLDTLQQIINEKYYIPINQQI